MLEAHSLNNYYLFSTLFDGYY